MLCATKITHDLIRLSFLLPHICFYAEYLLCGVYKVTRMVDSLMVTWQRECLMPVHSPGSLLLWRWGTLHRPLYMLTSAG